MKWVECSAGWNEQYDLVETTGLIVGNVQYNGGNWKAYLSGTRHTHEFLGSYVDRRSAMLAVTKRCEGE